jgi:cation transport ATPase
MKNIYQNLVGAFVYNVGHSGRDGLIISFLGLLLSPLIAGQRWRSSVTVVGNANRLRGFKPRFSVR